MESTKIDIVYYLIPTDFEMEFNLGDCCRLRLLTALTHDKREYIEGLSQAVSRSKIIITCGPLYGEEGLIYMTAKAIGKPLTLINNKDYGIVDDQNVYIIENSVPLVTDSGLFGGVIIESGPQTLIVLSETKAIRKNIMSNLIHPYIQELSILDMRGETPVKPEEAPAPQAEETADAPELEEVPEITDAPEENGGYNPDIDIVSSSANIVPDLVSEVGAVTAAAAVGVGAAEAVSEGLDAFVDDNFEEENTSADAEQVIPTEEINTPEETAEEIKEPENDSFEEDYPVTVISEEPSEKAPSDEELRRVAEEINLLTEQINSQPQESDENTETAEEFFGESENTETAEETAPQEITDEPEEITDIPMEHEPQETAAVSENTEPQEADDFVLPSVQQVDFTIDEDDEDEDTDEAESAVIEENFVKSTLGIDEKSKPFFAKDKSSHPVFLFEENLSKEEEQSAVDSYITDTDESEGKQYRSERESGTKILTISIIITAVLLFIIAAVLCYFLVYVPYSKGSSTSEFIKEIFNTASTAVKLLR